MSKVLDPKTKKAQFPGRREGKTKMEQIQKAKENIQKKSQESFEIANKIEELFDKKVEEGQILQKYTKKCREKIEDNEQKREFSKNMRRKIDEFVDERYDIIISQYKDLLKEKSHFVENVENGKVEGEVFFDSDKDKYVLEIFAYIEYKGKTLNARISDDNFFWKVSGKRHDEMTKQDKEIIENFKSNTQQ